MCFNFLLLLLLSPSFYLRVSFASWFLAVTSFFLLNTFLSLVKWKQVPSASLEITVVQNPLQLNEFSDSYLRSAKSYKMFWECVQKCERTKKIHSQDEEYCARIKRKEFVYIFGQHFSNVLKQYKYFHTKTHSHAHPHVYTSHTYIHIHTHDMHTFVFSLSALCVEGGSTLELAARFVKLDFNSVRREMQERYVLLFWIYHTVLFGLTFVHLSESQR